MQLDAQPETDYRQHAQAFQNQSHHDFPDDIPASGNQLLQPDPVDKKQPGIGNRYAKVQNGNMLIVSKPAGITGLRGKKAVIYFPDPIFAASGNNHAV